MDVMIGQVIDNYKIVEVLGRGGMGVVFRAFDLNLEMPVALKMIDPFLARDENFIKRFKSEAQALAKLNNPNIVHVFAFRETQSGCFMVMEYVQAKTISEWIREKGKFTIVETINVTRQILNAIAYVHNLGVIHRDIKPNNILLGNDGTVKVMDFGLAKIVQQNDLQKTLTVMGAGTLHYMSPEQVKGLMNVDVRVDIYSLGITIYEMITGRTPFDKEETSFNIEKDIIKGNIPSPLKYNPNIPPDLVRLISKAIDKNPAHRFQNIEEMKKDLSHINYKPDADDKTRLITGEGRKKPHKENNKKRNILIGTAIVLICFLSAYLIMLPDIEPPKKKINPAIDSPKIIINNDIQLAKLKVNSTPSGAFVYIDGKRMGRTPLPLDSLEVKRYLIEIKLDGYEGWAKRDYEVYTGDNTITQTLKAIPAIGNATLNLSMDVPGSISIDNQIYDVSVNQILTRTVSSGKRNIKFVNQNNVEKVVQLDLTANQSKSLTCYFKHRVNVQSLNASDSTFWGTIYVNGVSSEKTTPFTFTFGSDTYKITVKRAGFRTRESDIVLTIKPELEQRYHPLIFHLESQGAAHY